MQLVAATTSRWATPVGDAGMMSHYNNSAIAALQNKTTLACSLVAALLLQQRSNRTQIQDL